MPHYLVAYGELDNIQIRHAKAANEHDASIAAWGVKGGTCLQIEKMPKYLSYKRQQELIGIVTRKRKAEKEVEALDTAMKEVVGQMTPEEETVKEQQDYHHAEEFKRQLRDTLLATMDEYIDEAEHQDGYGYWRKFKQMSECLEDMALYIQSKYDQDFKEKENDDA